MASTRTSKDRPTGKRAGSRHAEMVFHVIDFEIDESTLSIKVWSGDRTHPQTLSVKENLSALPIGKELFDAVCALTKIPISVNTLRNHFYGGQRFANDVVEQGYTSIKDPDITPDFMELIGRHHRERAVMRTLFEGSGRPDTDLLMESLPFRTEAENRPNMEPFSDEEVEAIKEENKAVLKAIEKQQKDIFESLGFDVAGREWWSIPADEVIEKARKRDGKRPARDRVSGSNFQTTWDEKQIVDWLLLHPEKQQQMSGRPSSKSDENENREQARGLFKALYPGIEALTALAEMHALCENRGLNESTVLGFKPQHHTRQKDTGQVAFAKARNHTQAISAVTYGNKWERLGSLLEFATALTRFTRLYNQLQALAAAKENPRVNVGAADLVYSALSLNEGSKVISSRIGPHGSQRFQKLRRYALYSGQKTDIDFKAELQKGATRDHYLRVGVLPEAKRHSLTEEAQANMLDDRNDTDLSFTACETGMTLTDEQGVSSPCDLGPIACFTCENGYRSADQIPQLIVLRDDVAPVLEGTEFHQLGASLSHLAGEQIKRFDRPLRNPSISDEDRFEHQIVLADLITNWRTS